MTIAELNAASRAEFLAALDGIFEHSPWIAESSLERRPFADRDKVHAAMMDALKAAPLQKKLALIAAHPDLAGTAAPEGRITAESASEQQAAGLNRLTPDEATRFERLNAQYRRRFGFPFVICARDSGKAEILHKLERRAKNDPGTELQTAIEEIGKIAKYRLAERIAP